MEFQPSPLNKNPFSKVAFIILGIFSILSLIGLGYFLAKIDKPTPTVIPKEDKPIEESVIPTEIDNNELEISEPNSPQDGSAVRDGDRYYNDTIFLITKNSPRQILVATVSRTGKDNRFTQTSRISYFDGESWSRDQTSVTNQYSNISNDKITKSWDIELHQTRVMRQTVKGTVQLDGTEFNFNTETLNNEISVRSLPEYTKFISSASGTFKATNQNPKDAYVLYSRIYSTDAKTILVYDNDFSYKTNWLAFWGNDGSFYHFDKTQVNSTVPNYTSHAIGFETSKDGILKRTFNLSTSTDNTDNPNIINYNFDLPIYKSIQIKSENSFQKYPTIKYPWVMGYATGTIKDPNGKEINGIGIYEYINN